MSSYTVGIAGTAKNTGKTTTLTAVMEELKRAGDLTLALTSIGYDGEYFDTITGLPKPRIGVEPGHIVAIAEGCAIYNTAKLEPMEETDIVTPMGKVVISRVVKSGKVVLAGPNNRRELRKAVNRLRELGCDLIIVDGALSRIAPMTEVDGLLLATGASKNPDVARLTQETAAMMRFFSLPVLEPQGHVMEFASILTQQAASDFIEQCAAAHTLVIQGIMGELFLNALEAHPEALSGKRLIFADPTKLLLAGSEVITTARILQDLQAKSVEVGLLKAIQVIAVTVNPYYPQYRYLTQDYKAAYVSKEELHASVSQAIPFPCFDVVQQGGGGLYRLIDQARGAL